MFYVYVNGWFSYIYHIGAELFTEININLNLPLHWQLLLKLWETNSHTLHNLEFVLEFRLVFILELSLLN